MRLEAPSVKEQFLRRQINNFTVNKEKVEFFRKYSTEIARRSIKISILASGWAQSCELGSIEIRKIQEIEKRGWL